MKELWIKAEEEFKQEFFSVNGREPTDEEIQKLMPNYFSIFMGDLIDGDESKLNDRSDFPLKIFSRSDR